MEEEKIRRVEVQMDLDPKKLAELLKEIVVSYNKKLIKLSDKEKQWQNEMWNEYSLNTYVREKSITPDYDEFLETKWVKKESSKAKKYRLQRERIKWDVQDLFSSYAELEKICIDEWIVDEVKEIFNTLDC